MGVKLDKHDIIFSKLIRERSDWTCERCGKEFRYEPGGLQCSHYIGRANRATRWHTDNANAHCVGCHWFFTNNPNEHVRWYISVHGEGLEQLVTEKGRSIRKWTKADKEAMYEHYKAEYQRLIQLRHDGVKGRIEIENFV